MITLLLLKQIIALFLIMALGFLLVKLGFLKAEDSRVLSVVMLYLIGPCVILKSFQIEFTDEVRDGFLLAFGAAVLINIALLLMTKLFEALFHLRPVERTSIAYANAGGMILPLVSAVLGEEWMIYASAFMCVQLVFIWTHARMVLSGEGGASWKNIVTNINLIAVVIGIILLVTGIRLPSIAMEVFGQLSNTMGPLCMIMIGMLLANVDFRAVLGSARTYFITVLKMIVTPLLILALLKLSGLAGTVADGKMILFISFMAVTTPSASSITQLAQIYRNEPEYAGAINVMTTLACVVTMPLLTWLYMRVM